MEDLLSEKELPRRLELPALDREVPWLRGGLLSSLTVGRSSTSPYENNGLKDWAGDWNGVLGTLGVGFVELLVDFRSAGRLSGEVVSSEKDPADWLLATVALRLRLACNMMGLAICKSKFGDVQKVEVVTLQRGMLK